MLIEIKKCLNFSPFSIIFCSRFLLILPKIASTSLAEKPNSAKACLLACKNSFDSCMLLRSTKTLALRVQQHADNALMIAKMLQDCSKVNSVIYPGLPSHSQYDLATKQQKNPMGDPIYGSMISFECKTMDIRDLFLEKIKLFTLAESLGGVESLVCVPYNMTHASVPKEIKQSMGLSQNLIRLSVGIEYLDDLINDLAQALEV